MLGTWESYVGDGGWELGIHGRILKVFPSKASTNVLCELVGAFELSGGKNEIVAIILLSTSDRATCRSCTKPLKHSWDIFRASNMATQLEMKARYVVFSHSWYVLLFQGSVSGKYSKVL